MKETEKEKENKEQENYFTLIANNLPFDVWYKDLEGRYLAVNQNFIERAGKPKEEIIGKTDYDIYPRINADLYVISDAAAIKARKAYYSDSMFADGVYSEEFKAPVFNQEKKVMGTVGFSRDITEQRQKEEEITYLSFHDQLTGLYNRRFFEEEMRRLSTERNLPITLVMIDVNGLKLVNDAFGHRAGDDLLRGISNVLGRECRANDIVSRVGGDEFTLLLLNTGYMETRALMNRINEAIELLCTDKIVYSISYGWATKHTAEEEMEKVYMLAEGRMYLQKLSESPKMRNRTIESIMKTLYEKSPRVMEHSQNVSRLVVDLGRALGLVEEELLNLKNAAIMHDVGKIGLEEVMLNKERPYTSAEAVAVERHPEIGYQILRSVDHFAPIAEYVLYHHERIDGKGYPRGLQGEEIPLQSKIISIADSYEEMINRSGYKNAMSEEDAIREIRESMGTQFDPDIAKIFIEKVLKRD